MPEIDVLDLTGEPRSAATVRFLVEHWPEHVVHDRLWQADCEDGSVVFRCSCGDQLLVHAEVAAREGMGPATIQVARRKSMLASKKFWISAFVASVVVGYLGAGVALAQGTTGSPLDALGPILEALTGGRYAYAACLGIILVIACLKRWWNAAWMHTDVGGALLALGSGVAAATAAALVVPGAHLTAGLFWGALGVGVTAAGGYTTIKKLIGPILASIEQKYPWLEKVFDLVSWIYEHQPQSTQES